MNGRVVVVGAGIGGLTTAAVLARHGVSVDVLERRPGLPDQGTALGMWPAAVRALDGAGLGDELRRLAFPQTQGWIRRRDGAPLARIDVREPTYLISRPPLLRLLHRSVPAGAVSFGAAVDRLDQLSGYDVVVLADGSRSRLRDELWGARARPRPLPLRVWRGTLPGGRSTTAESWGPGALWGLTPREDGRTNWFACVHHDVAADRWDLGFLGEVYGDWHHEVRDAVAGVTADGAGGEPVLVHELTQSPRLPTYVSRRVALVGDAAHTMAPNLGRGACEAILDGVALGRALVDHPGGADALRAYDRARRRPSRRVVRGAALVSRVALARRGTGPRDAALRAASWLSPRRSRRARSADGQGGGR
ncbi:FAD-dependent oxidoreductase [Geodermatophilus sp. CPCC 206100]|uniref:FAD-dependent oxidoreductase n=1 Tax=Geodermatophilus sp. CPCC 206100 TaxID=3020054 RepID=UPI003B006538